MTLERAICTLICAAAGVYVRATGGDEPIVIINGEAGR